MDKVPDVSIVILTKNGGSPLRESIKRIFSQKVPFVYEVIIIDSGSTDDTLDFLKSYPVRLFQIKPKDFSFGPTRDFGFSQARGEYIVTVSQDVVPADNNWLQNLVIPLLNDEADAVQGENIVPDDGKTFFWEKIDRFYFTNESTEFNKSNGGVFLSCTHLAIKKRVWEEAHFGSCPMGEDKILQKKLHSKGYKIIFRREAVAYHGHHYDLKSLIKRCENEGFGWKYVGVKYSFAQMLKDLKQPMWVYGKLIRGILKREIRNSAELLFLFVRPIFLYKGNLLAKNYKF